MSTETDFLNEIMAYIPSEYSPDRFPLFTDNRDGDCLEVVLSDEPFNGERVDGRITIYRGLNTGDVVGVLVKGLSTWIKRVLENFPGMSLDLKDEGRFRLELLFGIEQYQSSDPKLAMCYRTLKQAAATWVLDIKEIGSLNTLVENHDNHDTTCK